VANVTCSHNSREFRLSKIKSVWVDTLNGSKVIVFSNVGLQKFKMAADHQNGGMFRHRLADRFLLSRGISVPKGMLVAFVVSSQYILLHPYRHPSIALRKLIRNEGLLQTNVSSTFYNDKL
jgi:hypothetical protein